MINARKRFADRFVGTTPSDEQQLEDRQKKTLKIFSQQTLGKFDQIASQFERILDVGCGDGNFSVLLQEACKAKEVYGIDISDKGVESARKNGVNAFQLDIDEENFPFEDDYFDAIFAGEVIEHLFDTDHFLDEVHRVLKPEGTFVLTTPNLAWWVNRLALLLGYQPYSMNVSLVQPIGHFYETRNVTPSFDHIRFFTLNTLKASLQIHRFSIISYKGFSMHTHALNYKSFIINLIDNIFSFFCSLSNGLLIACKKDYLNSNQTV